VTLSVGTLAAMLTDNALSASVPPFLLTQTAKAALMGAASVSVTTLTEGVLHTMFLTKLKIASVFVLILVAIGGAGVGVYYLHAQAPSPKSDTEPDKPAAKAPAKEADTLTALMQERLKLAQQEVKVCETLFQAGRVNFDALVPASKNLLKAELELSTKKADRLAAHERYVKMMEGWVEYVRRSKETGRASEVELLKAQYQLIDAKIDLEREKARK
jgi:hypothetical protein